ncbi:hypothetical protein F4553_000755 [Allocatelliglobosispora scoriae]|uniref:Uncharacterized protein n=1 Tax=Allocatelliglobosispora scoriae TaxID=643052 RepID=A0A841BJJ7_9ACTN|nr:hypothetical protein [Allocatelliglobosispora scoriae]MBB5867376.1 hypothetical protein [Allocatelliglobosispora scoriae]
MGPLGYDGLRESLIEFFGEPAEMLILEEEVSEVESGGSVAALSPYRYMSNVFFYGLLVPALERDDTAMIGKCCDFVEEVLRTDDDELRQCLTIRVSESVFMRRQWIETALRHAGPLWHAELSQR